MKKSVIAMVSLAMFIAPQLVSAHETHVYQIGEKTYQFVVGSLNEPIIVDDNTGVELVVTEADAVHEEEVGHGSAEGAVTGLDQTVQVELQAGDQKKVLALRPKYGAPGTYTAKFYPTVQTTYTYRFFGTVNNVPIDLSFSCNRRVTRKPKKIQMRYQFPKV